jgi:hypothetical protein
MIEIPEDGDRVRVVGAWVTDEDAGGWNEIHPAWKVEVLDRKEFYYADLFLSIEKAGYCRCCFLLFIIILNYNSFFNYRLFLLLLKRIKRKG